MVGIEYSKNVSNKKPVCSVIPWQSGEVIILSRLALYSPLQHGHHNVIGRRFLGKLLLRVARLCIALGTEDTAHW